MVCFQPVFQCIIHARLPTISMAFEGFDEFALRKLMYPTQLFDLLFLSGVRIAFEDGCAVLQEFIQMVSDYFDGNG